MGTTRSQKNHEALGRSHGGFGIKLCVIADGHGKALSFALAPGQAHELPSAYARLDHLSYRPGYVVCHRGTTAQKFREVFWDHGARPVIPTWRNELDASCPK